MEAGKTLLLDREDLIRQADQMKLAWVAVEDGEFHAKPQRRKEERKAEK